MGPLLGSLLACSFYTFLSLFHFERANPGQDFNQWEAAMGPSPWSDEMDRPSHGLSNADRFEPQHTSGDQPNHYTPDGATIDGYSQSIDREI